jgi:lipopolysaccharide transport system permease protein
MGEASTKVTEQLEFAPEKADRLAGQEAPFSKGLIRYYRDVIWHLVQRDFALRYKGSFLGVIWILVVPLMQLLTLVFVFRKVIPLNIDSYPAYVFTALVPWTWFSSCLNSAGGLFVTNRDLVRHPNFHPVILIFVNILSSLFLYLVELPLVFALLLAYGRSLDWVLLFLPLLIVVQGIFIAGLSFLIATWNVFYRDVQQMTNIVVTLFFWLTPVFYRPNAIDKKYQFLFDYNPLAILITSHRRILFYGEAPHWPSLLYCLCIAIVLSRLGYVIYKRQLNNVIDAI